MRLKKILFPHISHWSLWEPKDAEHREFALGNKESSPTDSHVKHAYDGYYSVY